MHLEVYYLALGALIKSIFSEPITVIGTIIAAVVIILNIIIHFKEKKEKEAAWKKASDPTNPHYEIYQRVCEKTTDEEARQKLYFRIIRLLERDI